MQVQYSKQKRGQDFFKFAVKPNSKNGFKYLKSKIGLHFSGRICRNAFVLAAVVRPHVGEDKAALTLEGSVFKDEKPLKAAVRQRVVEDLVAVSVPPDVGLWDGADLADDGGILTCNLENLNLNSYDVKCYHYFVCLPYNLVLTNLGSML